MLPRIELRTVGRLRRVRFVLLDGLGREVFASIAYATKRRAKDVAINMRDTIHRAISVPIEDET